jgi:predicted DNA-binding transcriptional regulator YafY
VERLILSMGTHATVVRPQELRGRVRKGAIELLERYGGPTPANLAG